MADLATHVDGESRGPAPDHECLPKGGLHRSVVGGVCTCNWADLKIGSDTAVDLMLSASGMEATTGYKGVSCARVRPHANPPSDRRNLYPRHWHTRWGFKAGDTEVTGSVAVTAHGSGGAAMS